MGAVDALRLITKGPGPPRPGEAGSGSSKSSIVKCQISLVNGVLIGVPIKRSAALPMLMARILANYVKGNRDGRRSTTTTSKRIPLMSAARKQQRQSEISYAARLRAATRNFQRFDGSLCLNRPRRTEEQHDEAAEHQSRRGKSGGGRGVQQGRAAIRQLA